MDNNILVRYYGFNGKIIAAIYSFASFEYWTHEFNCIDIMSCETGEMLYIKGR